jgi:hypothetical protein
MQRRRRRNRNRGDRESRKRKKSRKTKRGRLCGGEGRGREAREGISSEATAEDKRV